MLGEKKSKRTFQSREIAYVKLLHGKGRHQGIKDPVWLKHVHKRGQGEEARG